MEPQLRPGWPFATGTRHSVGQTRAETNSASFGAKFLPALSLTHLSVADRPLPPTPQVRERVGRKKKHPNGQTQRQSVHHWGQLGDGRPAPACDQQSSCAQAAACRCRPRGAGVQQNISKRVWARFRSVRPSLRPTLRADPLFSRDSAGQRSSASLMSFFLGAHRQVGSARSQRPSPPSGPALWPRRAARD